MHRSNRYIVTFTLVMTIIVGGVLALSNQLLGPAQKRSIEYDTKSQILRAVMDISQGKRDILSLYDERIESIVVDVNGEVVETINGAAAIAEEVDVAKEFKKDYKDRYYPVFKFMSDTEPGKIEAYIVPVYGSGLWDKIWGFVALDEELATIKGVSFGHRQETPGLGARIAEGDIQGRYIGKEIYNDAGRLVSITMVKGETGGGETSISNFEDRPHEVDGMSGATLTAKGVNEMMKKYLDYYQKYFDKVKAEN